MLRWYLSAGVEGKAKGCSKLGMLVGAQSLYHPRGRVGWGVMLTGSWHMFLHSGVYQNTSVEEGLHCGAEQCGQPPSLGAQPSVSAPS